MLASIVIALAVQFGPPPPRVSLILLNDDGLSAEGRKATEAVLDRLERGYLRISESQLQTSALKGCMNHPEPAPETCAAETLTRVGAQAGEIAIMVTETDGTLHWRCIGRNVRPFSPSRQSIALGISAQVMNEIEPDLLQRASACLTYAGHQSGW